FYGCSHRGEEQRNRRSLTERVRPDEPERIVAFRPGRIVGRGPAKPRTADDVDLDVGVFVEVLRADRTWQREVRTAGGQLDTAVSARLELNLGDAVGRAAGIGISPFFRCLCAPHARRWC